MADLSCVCDLPHAAGRCDSGTCRVDRCHEGWLDCNGDPTDGCEVDIDDDPEHCGACHVRCSDSHVTPLCRNRLCVGDCDPGWTDCNGDKATDGCEVHTAADPKHCGDCTTVCTKNNACISSSCTGVTLSFVEPATDYAFNANSRPSAVVAGDFDGDGYLDLFGVSSNSGDTNMYLGDGMGGVKNTIASAKGQYLGAKGGDLDHDGKLDVVVQTYYGVDVLFGKGDGTFEAPIVYGDSVTGHSPDDLAVGDVDGDGYLDVIYPDYTNDTVYVMLNDKTGGLQAPLTIPTGESGARATAVVLADFDKSGSLDFAVANYSTGSVDVFLNDGTGAFTAKGSLVGPVGADRLAAGDVDGDGNLDLAVGSGGGSQDLFLGAGDGTFGAPFEFDTPGGIGGVAIGDLNGDGINDVVTANVVDNADTNGDRTITVFLGSGDAAAPLQYTNPAPTDRNGVFRVGASPQAPILVDWDANGQLDVVTANGNAGDTVDVLLNSTM